MAGMAAAHMANAQVPMQFAYQGRLTDSNNVPIIGIVTCDFQIIKGGTDSDPTSGTPVYHETATVTTDVNGIFSHAIGRGTPMGGHTLIPADFGDSPSDAAMRYIQVGLVSSGETNILRPRTQVSSVAFSMNSALLAGRDWSSILDSGTDPEVNSINGRKIAKSSIPFDRMLPRQIAISRAGKRKNGDGDWVNIDACTVNIKSSGRPLFVGVIPELGADRTASAANVNGHPSIGLRIIRDDVVIAVASYSLLLAQKDKVILELDVGGLWTVDEPTIGDHTYQLQLWNGNEKTGTSINAVRLVAWEL